MDVQWWFASEDMSQKGYSKLQSPTEAGSSDYFFKDAQKLSITVEGCFVREKMDPVSKNDLIIATRHVTGNKAGIDKLHFYKRNVPPSKYEGDFFNPVVLATRDFKESDQEITIQVRVYDEDGLDKSEAQEVENGIQAGATAAAIAFPALAPYAGLASGVGTALTELIRNLNKHDCIIDGRVRLAVNKGPNLGYKLLQPGFFVCFEQDVDASELFLGNNNRVLVPSGNAIGEYKHMSYIVLRVTRDYLQTPDYVIDEKAATLLAELDSGKGVPARRALDFMRSAFVASNNFNRLKRYTQLASKAQLTPDEKALLDELKIDEEIRPFLPTAEAIKDIKNRQALQIMDSDLVEFTGASGIAAL